MPGESRGGHSAYGIVHPTLLCDLYLLPLNKSYSCCPWHVWDFSPKTSTVVEAWGLGPPAFSITRGLIGSTFFPCPFPCFPSYLERTDLPVMGWTVSPATSYIKVPSLVPQNIEIRSLKRLLKQSRLSRALITYDQCHEQKQQQH